MARTGSPMSRRRRYAGTVVLGLLLLGLAVTVGLAELSRLERDPRELIIGVTGGPEPAVTRLLEALARTRPDLELSVRELHGGAAEARALLREARVDFILYAGGYRLDGVTGPRPEVSEWALPGVRFYAARVPATRFLHPLQGITAGEARGLLNGIPPDRSGDPDCFPLRLVPSQDLIGHSPGWDGIALLEPQQLGPTVQALAIDGVAPSFANLVTGAYPLSRPIDILARAPRYPLAWARNWPAAIVLRYDPNRPAILAFRAFLAEPAAQLAVAGEGPPVVVAAVGDIMLARGVGRLIQRHGAHYPFDLVRDRVAAADVAFANLESPIGTGGRPLPGKEIWFRAEPAAVPGLAASGFDILTLANNHILDYDSELLRETLALLDAADLGYTGAGSDIEAALRPAIVQVGEITLAFLGFSDFAHIFWSHAYPRTFLATGDVPGVAPADGPVFSRAIARARQEADFVIAAFHWGEEYVNYPTDRQRELGRLAVEAGADVVLGSHPHSVQGFEIIDRRLVAYSLGNFIMDQRRPIQTESMILEIELLPSGIRQVRVIPVLIEEFRPRILDGAAAGDALAKLRRISLPFAGEQD
ncbi:MAG TPA: hypothetical protein DEQ28_05655 [Clostridiales bacterium]|nr:hypothetical protein [Clostridiales bacterium]